MVKRGLAFGGILAILSGVGIHNNIYAATEGATKFSVDVNNAVLELTVPSSPAVIDLNPTMTNASFGSTSINVHVATNNITGYTLTMTPTNNQEATSLIRTELIGDEQNYREIETLELTDPVSTGYTEQTFTANKWGYRILSNSNYYGIDSTNPTVSSSAWVTSEPTNGTNHNLTVAAKVDSGTISGSYETTLVFTATTNATTARDIISFNANGGTGTMEGTEAIAGTSITLPANTFTAPTGYRFSGWSTTQNGQGDGVRYYTNKASYTATDTGVNKHVTLYAQWTNLPCVDNCNNPEPDPTTGAVGTTLQRAYEIAYTAKRKGMWEEITVGSNTFQYIDSWNSVNYQGEGRDVRFLIQDMTPEICASATEIGSTATVLDVRDQTSYRIVKAADNRCWMQDNLAIDLTNSTILNTISSINTNINASSETETAILTSLKSGNRSAGNQYATSGVSTNWGYDSHCFSTPLVDLANKDVLPTTDSDKDEPLASAVAGEKWKVGGYYNYCAASAGSYCYGGTNNNPYGSPYNKPNTAIDVESDICPFGWRMPTGSSYNETDRPDGGEFQTLYDSYSGNNGTASGSRYANFRTALRLPLSGCYYDSSACYQGSYGFFWSSTYYYSSNMYNMYLGLSGKTTKLVEPQSGFHFVGRAYGYSIRCIAKNGNEPAPSN